IFVVVSFFFLFFLMIRPTPISSLFPYTTLFRSRIVNSENQIFFSKWHVGYLRGLFYFYPILLPKFIQNATVDEELNIENYKSSRSEEHTSELQSRENLVCRLLLEKKNKI